MSLCHLLSISALTPETLKKQLKEALGAVGQTLQQQVQQALPSGSSAGKQDGAAKQGNTSKQEE